ncbi:MAG TPA: hypothetical protein VL523_17825 [Terriglobia bacterium]|nr:hypothetical protein [Terriglobia bacterium]
MKTRIALSVVFILTSLSTVAVAQSDAQKSFDQLKTLAGSWQGNFEGKPVQVTLRVTSMGNALMHEMTGGGPEDPITMLYVDNDRLTLTHYCDAGNRPRMVAKESPDGKTVDFDLLDVAGSMQHGHMDRAVFTLIDANHHTEDWTYMEPGDKPVQAHLDLQRTK